MHVTPSTYKCMFIMNQRLKLHLAIAGGVLYARNPLAIATRCSRFAYGVEVTEVWKVGDPEPPSKFQPVGQEQIYARGLFHSLVKMNEAVGVDQEVSSQHATHKPICYL